ncbi:MAG: BatA domain-containing protein [Thermoguttaceae bacterium]
MTFVSAAFLLAAVAGAIPILLHMINRQQAKKLPFSTLRFLRISAEKTRRRKRIHDVLLMLLRMAVLILIAIGLAEPTVTTLGSFWGSGASAVAIVVDNSASMGLIDQGRPRFETAREAARSVLNELADGDQVALLLTGGPEFAEQGRVQRAQDRIRQMLDQAEVSYERADLAMRVQEARKLLEAADSKHRQIFVISDMQELSWQGLEEAAKAAAKAAGKGAGGKADAEKGVEIPLIFIDCHRNPKPNVGVSGLELSAPVPVAGLPVGASVEVFNASSVPQKRLVELYIDGAKEATSPELEIAPAGRMKHDFQFAFKRGGTHRGEVRLVGEDGSGYDDQRYFSMEVDQGIPVSIVKSQRHEISYLEETFYLEQALAPERSGGGWALRTTVLTADELRSEPLSDYKVVFCVNLEAPDAESAQRLRSYVAGGGNLFWIAGDNVDPAAYNAMNQAAGGQLLPAPLVDVRLPSGQDDRDSWHIASLDKTHPATAPLLEPASMYRSVLVYKLLRLDTAAVPGTRVLARLDDGEALLAQARVEQGSVTLLGTSAHVGWSNLPLRPIFLPLLARLTFDLAGAEQARHRALAGSPLVLPLDEANAVTVEVRPPSGAMIRRESRPVKGGAGQEFVYADTHGVGIYTLQLLNTARPATIAWSVNLDAEEIDPATIGHEEIRKRLGGTPVVFADDPEDLSSMFRKLREGESLWEFVLAGVLLALVFETFISNLLNPQQSERRSPMEDYGSLRVRTGFGYKAESSGQKAAS